MLPSGVFGEVKGPIGKSGVVDIGPRPGGCESGTSAGSQAPWAG